MVHTRTHRALSLLLAVLMFCSLLPVQAAAAETENASVTHFQEDMDGIMVTHLGSTDLTQEEIYDAVAAMGENYRIPLQEICALGDAMTEAVESAQVTGEELDALLALERNQSFVLFAEMLQSADSQDDVMAVDASSATLTLDSGSLSFTDAASTDGDMTVSGTTVTLKVISGFLGNKTKSITVTNTSGVAVTVQFNYSGTSPTFSSNVTTTGSSASVSLDAGGTFTIAISAKYGNWGASTTSTLTLTNVTIMAAASGAVLTVDYLGGNASSGSVTCGGTAVSDGGTVETDGTATLTASGTGFLGWVDSNYTVLSKTADVTVTLASDMTVHPVFAGTEAWFWAGSKLIDNLNTAAAAGSTVIPANNGTLPAGNYTIPSGVTLLIPFNADHTCYTTMPAQTETSASPTVYRTLTMASGAKITVANGGAISVSAQQRAASTQVTSVVNGAYGQIKMQGNSQIDVQSGGNLYAWGYISRAGEGSEGTVTIQNGGKVYEMFQVTGYRGGSITNSEYDNSNGVFILNQYYVQNVEVPMTLYAGASEKCVFSVTAKAVGKQTATFDFFGTSAGMFRISEGSVTKDYIEDTDRLKCTVNSGTTMSLSNIKINIAVAIVNINMDSTNYVLPIQNNIDVVVGSQSTVSLTQNMALLPGASLTVDEGAKVTVSTGALYVYDLDGWGNYAYSGQTHYCIPYAQGKSIAQYYRTLTDATLEVNGTFKGTIYSVGGPANIHGTGKLELTAGTETGTYQYDQSAGKYPEIAITPAVLQNAATHTVEASFQSGTNIYTFDSGHGAWIIQDTALEATCTKPGHTADYCHKCGYYKTSPATGNHTYGDWEIATAPTFETAGKRTTTCTVCNSLIEEAFDSAQIGETPYQTLKEALAAAQECGTVKLLADISGEASVSQIVTIDKGDYSASITAAAGFALSENGSRVSVLGKIDSINIVAGDGLDLKFYVYTTAFKNSNYTAVITRTKADSTETVMIPFSEWGTEENGYYSFSYNGIAAKEMTDDITVFVKNSDDIQVSNETTQSIKSYATLTLKRKDNLVTDRLRTVLMDMLYYGASAQTHFGYKQDDLANADEAGSTVLADNAVYLSTTLPEANSYLKHDGYLGAVSVSAKSRLMLTFYFKSISTDMTAVITYTDHYGNPEKVIVPGSAFVTYGNMLGVDVTGLAVADGTALVECSLYQGTIEENTDLTTLTPVASATDSVEGYIARNGSGVVSLEYMLKFIHSARTYFSTP